MTHHIIRFFIPRKGGKDDILRWLRKRFECLKKPLQVCPFCLSDTQKHRRKLLGMICTAQHRLLPKLGALRRV